MTVKCFTTPGRNSCKSWVQEFIADFDKQVELQALITEREGFIARNAYDMAIKGHPLFLFDEFENLAAKMRALKEKD